MPCHPTVCHIVSVCVCVRVCSRSCLCACGYACVFACTCAFMCVKTCASVYVLPNCLLIRTIAVGGGRRRVHHHCKGTLVILPQRTSLFSLYYDYPEPLSILFILRVPGGPAYSFYIRSTRGPSLFSLYEEYREALIDFPYIRDTWSLISLSFI